MSIIGLLLLLLFILMVVFDILNKALRNGGSYFRWAVLLFLIANSGLLAGLIK